MKNYWEVDIGLSEFDLGWPWRGHFKVTKVTMACIVLTVAPRPRVPLNKMFTIAQLIKVHVDLWPWLTFRGHSRSRMWKSHISSWWCEISIWLLWHAIGKLISKFQNPQKIWLRLTLTGHFKVMKVKMARIVWTVAPSPSVPIDNMFTIAQSIKVHHDIWPWLTLGGHFKVTNVKIANILLMVRG